MDLDTLLQQRVVGEKRLRFFYLQSDLSRRTVVAGDKIIFISCFFRVLASAF